MEPRHHHFAPQFYLRNFACDAERLKIAAVTKHGDRAVWRQRSIRYVGAKQDFYYHPFLERAGDLERKINRGIENPISESSTWRKIASGQEALLNEEDMPVLYALARHMEARTPHSLQTMRELIDLSAERPADFSPEEREMYDALRINPDLLVKMFGIMSGSTAWIWKDYPLARITVHRTSIPIRTSTTPVHVMQALDDPALHLPLPGQVPHAKCLSLSESCFITLILGRFSGPKFINEEVADEVAKGFNRHRLLQFAHFASNEHLITNIDDDVIDDMSWAGYEVEKQGDRKIVFRRLK